MASVKTFYYFPHCFLRYQDRFETKVTPVTVNKYIINEHKEIWKEALSSTYHSLAFALCQGCQDERCHGNSSFTGNSALKKKA